MRVGMLTQNFTGLSGANDFLKHIIFSLQSVARNQKLELFILLDIFNYRRHKGVKRFFAKQREMRQARSIFKEFKNIKFVYSMSLCALLAYMSAHQAHEAHSGLSSHLST